MKNRLVAIAALMFCCLLILPASSLALEVGDQAPTFAALSNQGELSLEDYAGEKHVVLALYFAAFSPV